MSSTSTPNDSPFATPIQPLHNPSQAAHVVVPQAPLGNVANHTIGMGAKALLAKKMAKSHNPTYISPTDKLMTPCSQKLTAAKKRHLNKSAKPIQLFAQPEGDHDNDRESENAEIEDSTETKMSLEDDEENPF